MKDLLLSILAVVISGAVAWLIKLAYTLVKAKIAELIQEAEKAIQGSGLGSAKKAWVIAQLKLIGIGVNTFIDNIIDDIVREINKKNLWYTESANEALKAASKED